MKQRKPTGKKRKLWAAALLTALALGTATLSAAALYLAPYARQRMDMSLMNVTAVSAPSELYAYLPAERAARSGELHQAPNAILGDRRFRIHTSYGDMPPELIHAFVAIEDKRFWQHDGVDLLRTLRAGLNYIVGSGSFGGSTITQQLVKNLTGQDDRSVDRKLTEIFRALDLEKQADKTQILEAYLNIINLAEGCYGVGAAAERYFSKEVKDLTLPECATLAAITNNPARYDPLTHPQNNRARRDTILYEMAEQGYISEEERDEAMGTELSLRPSAPKEPAPTASWYADMVVADVVRDLQERLGYSYEAATMLVYGGGLRIEAAMDEDLQAIVEEYYRREEHFPTGEGGRPQSAVILMDPYTGDILAVAGAVGEKTANRLQNYATDTRRPAGSCIKPLSVYAPALQKGLITWASVYEDEPLEEKDGRPWPANADGLYRGRVTVGQAVAHSLNPVAVRILREVGMDYAFSFARDGLGLHSLIPSEGQAAHDVTVSSLALGQQSRGVTARELTAAYTAFLDGTYRPPVSYHRVLDANGKILLENKAGARDRRVLSPENAAVMTRLLMTVTEEGTAARYMTLTQRTGISAAGKTGTTQNNCDRWFVGYTPRLLAGVWMGYDYPAELRGIRGNPCVGIWDELMGACEETYRGRPYAEKFDIPHTVTELEFCPLSGELTNPYCHDPVYGHPAERGWFARGTEPRTFCTLHTEPPISVIPEDPTDPDRIPALPNDLVTEEETAPPPLPPEIPWYRRWLHGRSGNRGLGEKRRPDRP